MKHWVSLGWDEENQRLTIVGQDGPRDSVDRSTRTIIERGANESHDRFASRVGVAAIAAAQGKNKDVN